MYESVRTQRSKVVYLWEHKHGSSRQGVYWLWLGVDISISALRELQRFTMNSPSIPRYVRPRIEAIAEISPAKQKSTKAKIRCRDGVIVNAADSTCGHLDTLDLSNIRYGACMHDWRTYLFHRLPGNEIIKSEHGMRMEH